MISIVHDDLLNRAIEIGGYPQISTRYCVIMISMSYYETESHKRFVKVKDRRLIFAFVIANLIFGNSTLVGYIIVNVAMTVAVVAATSPFDENTQLFAGFISAIVFWFGYLWLKIYLFKYIYLCSTKLGASTSIYKFLNTFLYNNKVKTLVIFAAIFFDCIIMSVYAYLHFKSIAPKYWLATPETISNILLVGGLAPSYIMFALIGKVKHK